MSKRMCLLGLLVCSLVWFGCSSDSSNEAAGGGAAKPATTMGGGSFDGAAMAAAMAKATSYKMTTKTAQAEMTMEVVCPDKTHMTTKTGAMTSEMMRVGKDMYTKVGNKWMKVPTTGQPDNVCAANSDPSKMPKTDATAKITKGGTQTINGETCTEWTTTVGTTSSTMCIGSDNLPRQMKTADATITYSDWNKPITIEAPK